MADWFHAQRIGNKNLPCRTWIMRLAPNTICFSKSENMHDHRGFFSAFLDFHASMGLLACYALYLSLVSVGQVFNSYQWDAFLLESGFLALFLPGGSPLTLWLFRLLLFRFMFMGGVVKLTSGDPTWRQLTTLDYHFETQGLMTVKLGWLTRPISNPAS